MPKKKAVETDNSLKQGEYTYQNGHHCYVLYRGAKPTQANILIEASKEATIQHAHETLSKE